TRKSRMGRGQIGTEAPATQWRQSRRRGVSATMRRWSGRWSAGSAAGDADTGRSNCVAGQPEKLAGDPCEAVG
ncbi:hypothetical protein, partial [Salmonella enterica]|uniref:hypothetical protein n=1 Tax=Salmonella enterica TaxID=28901 RepID=UPI001C118C10